MAHYHCELGESDLAKGALAAAMEHARAARGLQPGSVRGLLLMAEVLRARGDLRKAMKLLRAAPEQYPDMLPLLLPVITDGFRRLGDNEGLAHWLQRLDERPLMERGEVGVPEEFRALVDVLAQLEAQQPAARCHQCGFQATQPSWQCPGCHGWDSLKPLDEWQTHPEIHHA